LYGIEDLDCGRTSDITFDENTALNFLISLIGVLCKVVLHSIRRWEATRNGPRYKPDYKKSAP